MYPVPMKMDHMHADQRREHKLTEVLMSIIYSAVVSVMKLELCNFCVMNSHVRRLREADFGT